MGAAAFFYVLLVTFTGEGTVYGPFPTLAACQADAAAYALEAGVASACYGGES